MPSANLNAKAFTISVTANDLSKSLKFYADLGFETVDKFETDGKVMGAMLQAGNANIGISQDDFTKGRERVKGVGMGLFIETDQDLEVLAKRVKDAGIAFEKELSPLPWGPMAFVVRDPDGFSITVSQPG
jgi:uncharacterized glyoxalase superfamily protein PhnB